MTTTISMKVTAITLLLSVAGTTAQIALFEEKPLFEKPLVEPLFESTVRPLPVRCISDEDCLQRATRDQCPLFCIDGICKPHDKPHPPVLRIRTGEKADFSKFRLREDEELERVFTDPPVFFPRQSNDPKHEHFFELTDGSDDILEVRYPADFFRFAQKNLENPKFPGHVDGRGDENTPTDGDVERGFKSPFDDNDLPSVGTTTTTTSSTSTTGFSEHNNAGFDFGDFFATGRGRRLFQAEEEEQDEEEDTNRRLLAIQDESPDRWRVTNTEDHPWRRNGRLSVGCTGAMIGNRVLVTAAHCVWDRDTNSWASFPIYFAAGQDGSTYKPYGDARVWKMTIPRGYQTCSSNNECRAHDWAVLVLYDWAALNVGYFGFSTHIGSSRLNLAGYPASKSRQLWYDHCPLYSDEGDWIKHRCDTEKGNSGSGIYKIVSGSRYVVAIHGGGYAYSWNRGADVDGDTSSAGRLFDRMLAYRQEYG